MKESNLIKKKSGTDKIFYKESVLWFANILFYRLKFFSFLPLFSLGMWPDESHAKFKKTNTTSLQWFARRLFGWASGRQASRWRLYAVRLYKSSPSNRKNVIYAIAGDMFRGSIIDSEYKGVSTIEIMNALAPDIVKR